MTDRKASSVTPDSPEGLEAVEREIIRACADARRERASVELIAVSKTFDAAAISPVISAGQRVFGENRVQEAKAKWPELGAATPDIKLHLIGPLQSNKAREAVMLFDAIHSVDRPSICEALSKEIKSQKRNPLLFALINTGEEPQKAGVIPHEADAFIAACSDLYGLSISGPMRASNRSIAPRVMPTHPAVGAKLSRARCRNTALPRPGIVGRVLWSISIMKS